MWQFFFEKKGKLISWLCLWFNLDGDSDRAAWCGNKYNFELEVYFILS